MEVGRKPLTVEQKNSTVAKARQCGRTISNTIFGLSIEREIALEENDFKAIALLDEAVKFLEGLR